VGVLHLNALPIWTPFGTVGLDLFKSWTPTKLVKIYQSRSACGEGVILLQPRAWSADFFSDFRWSPRRLTVLLFIPKVLRAFRERFLPFLYTVLIMAEILVVGASFLTDDIIDRVDIPILDVEPRQLRPDSSSDFI